IRSLFIVRIGSFLQPACGIIRELGFTAQLIEGRGNLSRAIVTETGACAIGIDGFDKPIAAVVDKASGVAQLVGLARTVADAIILVGDLSTIGVLLRDQLSFGVVLEYRDAAEWIG